MSFLKGLFVSTAQGPSPHHQHNGAKISTPSSASEAERRKQRKKLLSQQRDPRAKNFATAEHSSLSKTQHTASRDASVHESSPPHEPQYYTLDAPISSSQYAKKGKKTKQSTGAVKVFRGAAFQLPNGAVETSSHSLDETATSSSSTRTSSELSALPNSDSSNKNLLSHVRSRASSNAEKDLHFTASSIHQSSSSRTFSKKWKKTHSKPAVVKHNSDTNGSGRLRALSLSKRTKPSSAGAACHTHKATPDILSALFTPIGNSLHTQSSGSSDTTLSPNQRHRNHSNLDLNDESGFVSKLRREKFLHLLEEPHTNVAALRKLSWNGVPNDLRAEVWKIIIGYLPRSKTRRDTFLQSKRSEYLDLVEKYYYDKIMGKTEEEHNILHQIHIDVPRTNPEVPLFQRKSIQEALERILYLWSIRHASGYVQGLNDLVTPFLVVYLHEIHPVANLMEIDIDEVISKEDFQAVEADTFFSFSLFLDMIQDHYSFGQPGIQRMVQKLEDITEKIDRPLYSHFMDLKLNFLQFSFRWMNCVLMRELSIKQIIRLFDAFLSETNDKETTSFETMHVYVCAAFLTNWSTQLQQLDFTELVIFLQHLPTQDWGFEQIDLLLSRAFMLKEMFEC